MPTKLLQELYDLWRYIAHVMNESDYDPDDLSLIILLVNIIGCLKQEEIL